MWGMQGFFVLIFCHFKKRQKVKSEAPLTWSSLLGFCVCLWCYCICSLKKWKKKRMDQMWDSFYSYSICAGFKEMVTLFAVFWENILSSFCSAHRLVEIGLERYFKSSSCPSYCLKADSRPVLFNSMINSSITITFFFFFSQKHCNRK